MTADNPPQRLRRAANAYVFATVIINHQLLDNLLTSPSRCLRCRSRKVKCSGTHPCDKCRHRSLECVFEEDKKILVSEEYAFKALFYAVYGLVNCSQIVSVYETEAQRARRTAFNCRQQ